MNPGVQPEGHSKTPSQSEKGQKRFECERAMGQGRNPQILVALVSSMACSAFLESLVATSEVVTRKSALPSPHFLLEPLGAGLGLEWWAWRGCACSFSPTAFAVNFYRNVRILAACGHQVL